MTSFQDPEHFQRLKVKNKFQMLIAILFGWGIAGIFTATGLLTDDPDHEQYKARTDARSYVISSTPWFYIPFPGNIVIFVNPLECCPLLGLIFVFLVF